MSVASTKKISVNSEIGILKKLMIHHPDEGLAVVVPSKAQDWLFEDIIDVETMRKDEYDYYVKILLYFLDPEKIQGKLAEIDAPENKRTFFQPHHENYFASDKVLDPQHLLAEILAKRELKIRLVASICAIERSPYKTKDMLIDMEARPLAQLLISGITPEGEILFPPIPNFIFTRDIGIVINDHILLNRPKKVVRLRESLIMQYIFYNHPYFQGYQDKVIEIEDHQHRFFLDEDDEENYQITLEGGDIMVVHENHVLIGHSERTSINAVNRFIQELFDRDIVEKISVITIPKKRDFMHIDTIFTQVKRDTWVLFGALSRENSLPQKPSFMPNPGSYKANQMFLPQIKQFRKGHSGVALTFNYLEDLLNHISQEDFQSKSPTQFIYSGNSEFPYELREQWTDSCNVLAIQEGVVLGYDRNQKTSQAFRDKGFQVIKAQELISQLEAGTIKTQDLKDTLILLPSAELSRARGGAHCMSMPLLREKI